VESVDVDVVVLIIVDVKIDVDEVEEMSVNEGIEIVVSICNVVWDKHVLIF
jgi:hypothetical protein